MNDSNISTSKIMLKSFISYYQLKEYMALLLQTELIKHVNKERNKDAKVIDIIGSKSTVQ